MSLGEHGGGEQFGDYELGRRLAVGRDSELFIATRAGAHGFAKELALKRFRAEFSDDPKRLAALAQDARDAAALRGPAIVELFELGCVGTTYYLAMEWVDGLDLGRLVAAQALSAAEVAWVAAVLCDALAQAESVCADDGVPARAGDLGDVLVARDGSVRVLPMALRRRWDRRTLAAAALALSADAAEPTLRAWLAELGAGDLGLHAAAQRFRSFASAGGHDPRDSLGARVAGALPAPGRHTATLSHEATMLVRPREPSTAAETQWTPRVAGTSALHRLRRLVLIGAAAALVWALQWPGRQPDHGLSLDSDPAGARVLVGGADAGLVTPVRLGPLPELLSFGLVLPRPRESSAPLSISEATPPVSQPAPVASSISASRLAPARAPATGRLSVRTVDLWADVYLGRRKLGTTPLSDVVIPVGRHELLLHNPVAGLRKTQAVTVVQGEIVRVTVEMRD